MKILQIDLKKVIQEKSNLLAKIPFFVPWLKKTIHEDEINVFLRDNSHLYNLDFVTAVLEFFQVHVETIVLHPEAIDPQGRYIFAANHPLGGLDGMAFIKAVSSMFTEIKFPVNDILLHLENVNSLFLPIDKHGKLQSREAVQKINEAYASKTQQMLIFPAGLVSRKIQGEIVDLPWKDHFIKKAIETQRDIIPVYIEGRNSERFYRLSKWRKRFGLPNIEMLYLPDEVFRQRNKTIKIIFGKPISYKTFTKKSAQSDADYVKNKVYELNSH
ncbi:MAG: glycerol acyltransferase [candidate division SR1 bacterium]|nr:glycerol acyltransferase [candidate division SR1 bacterium]